MTNFAGKIVSIVSFLFFVNISFAQTEISDNQKLIYLCKVWGFLKYYHPIVASGKLDWDQVLVERIKLLPAINGKKQFNDFFINWINDLGNVKLCKSCENKLPDSLKRNFDLTWIDNRKIFSDSLSFKLHYIENNRIQRDYYYAQLGKTGYIDFSNEKDYLGLAFPDYPYRLLSLFRYWNIIEYFYPYKYAVGKNWTAVLDEFIPKFKNAADTLDYHLAMLQLVRNLNDTHAFFGTDQLRAFNGNYRSPIRLRIINDTVLVTGYYNFVVGNKDELFAGDRILKINNKDVDQIIKERLELTIGSNEAVRLRNVVLFLLRGNSDSLKVSFQRKGSIQEKKLKLYPIGTLKIDSSVSGSETWKMLDNEIGYINLGYLKLNHVDEVMNNLSKAKAIIFDIRNYPYDIEKRLLQFICPFNKPFVKTTIGNLAYPGLFVPLRQSANSTKNKNYYKGRIILLVNEETQSHAEFLAMALQTAPNAVTIGSQTAGADGNVVKIVFPGGFITSMSGLGIYYPDGTETQRKGVKIDIIVKPTAKGIIEGRDEVLEKAIAIAGNGD